MSRRTFGSIRKLPSGRWQASYWHEGHRHLAPETFPTKALANMWLSQMAAEIYSGEWMDPRSGEITLARWCDWYLENATHKRATTVARDRSVIETHLLPVLSDIALKDITPLKIRELVTSWTGTMAAATVRTDYGVLRAILNAAVDSDVIARSPCRGVRMPAHQRNEVRFVSPDELERLAAATPTEYRPMIYVAGVLGLRWSEVAGLRVGRLDLKARTLRVVETLAEVEGHVSFAEVKTPAARRTITMPKFLAAMLAQHLMRRGRPGPDELVFVSPDGGSLHAGNFRNRVWARTSQASTTGGPYVPRTSSLRRRSSDLARRAGPRDAGADGALIESCHARHLRTRPSSRRSRLGGTTRRTVPGPIAHDARERTSKRSLRRQRTGRWPGLSGRDVFTIGFDQV